MEEAAGVADLADRVAVAGVWGRPAGKWGWPASGASARKRRVTPGTYNAWIHSYNRHRPHAGIRGKTPIERVHNLYGKNS